MFKVDGQALKIRKTLILGDAGGSELFAMEAKLMSSRPTMKIERGGQLYATVTREFTWSRPRCTITLENGPVLEARGNFTNLEYEISTGHQRVATISRRWFAVRDVYGVAIAPGQDVPFVLASTICIESIDQMAVGRG